MTMSARVLLTLTTLASSTTFAASDEMAVGGTHLASPSPYFAARTGLVWSRTFVEPGTSAVSVYIRQLDLDSDDYLVVENGEQELLFTAGTTPGFWTEPLAGSSLKISLYATGRSTGGGVLIDAYRVSTTPDPTMSIYQRNDMTPIADAPDELYAVRGPVARVYMQGVGYCTGFMLSPSLMMTNNHCVSSQATCDRTVAQFNYEVGEDGLPTQMDEVQCAQMVETDYGLDFTVIRLEGAPGDTWGFYDLVNATPTSGSQGSVIQHPSGQRKQASFAPNCTLLGVAAGNEPDSDFKHQCDTEGGSSGSPMLDESLGVIGLHHFGGAGKNPRSTNQAVRMDKILGKCRSCTE